MNSVENTPIKCPLELIARMAEDRQIQSSRCIAKDSLIPLPPVYGVAFSLSPSQSIHRTVYDQSAFNRIISFVKQERKLKIKNSQTRHVLLIPIRPIDQIDKYCA